MKSLQLLSEQHDCEGASPIEFAHQKAAKGDQVTWDTATAINRNHFAEHLNFDRTTVAMLRVNVKKPGHRSLTSVPTLVRRGLRVPSYQFLASPAG